MVKLIKLNSPKVDDLINFQARFTSHFQEDINIKPNARIALRNIQFSLVNVDKITGSMGLNVSIKTNLDGSLNNKIITLPNQEYEGKDLGDMIYQQINSAFAQTDCPLIRTGVYNRVMFDTAYSATNNFELSFYFVEDNYNTGLTSSPNILFNGTTLNYTKSANGGNWDLITSGNMPISLGTGTNYCEVVNTSGFLIGVHWAPLTEDLTFNELAFKVFTDSDSLYYKWQEANQASVITNILVSVGDKVDLAVQNGHFVFKLVRANGTVVNTGISQSIDYIGNTGRQQYYCYFGLKFLTSSIRDIRWTKNPFYTTNELGIFKTDVQHIVQSSLSDAVPSDVNISFFGENEDGDKMYQILGFTSVSYKITGVSGTFSSERKTTDNQLPDGFYVTIDNLRLSSYDYNPLQVSGRRKNILSNITSYDFSDTYNIIKYETDYPIYIDLDNKDPFTLNSLTISIYTQDNQLLTVGAPDDALITTPIDRVTPIKMTLLIDG